MEESSKGDDSWGWLGCPLEKEGGSSLGGPHAAGFLLGLGLHAL